MPIKAEQVGLLLLAAGRSARFDGGAKLCAILDGQPLGLHSAKRMQPLPFACHMVVTGPSVPDYGAAGFTAIPTDNHLAGQGHSLSLGIRAVAALPVEACLIMLADMPFVTRDHISKLLDGFDGDILASSLGGQPLPPVLIGRPYFDALTSLDQDQGAKALLAGAKSVAGDARCLADVDTLDDLKSWA